MKSKILLTFFIALMLCFFVNCGDTKEDAAPVQTPAPKAEPENSPKPESTPAPESTPKPQDAKIASPEDLVKTFMKACEEKNKDLASKLAVPKVVDRFFSVQGSAEGLTFQGCNEDEKDKNKHYCAYSYEGGSMSFTITGDATNGFKIISEEETAD